MPRRTFQKGVYCPVITPFVTGTEEVDYEAFQVQVLRLAKAGVGLVLLGTNGEASHLSDIERSTLIRRARETLDKNGFAEMALVAGTGTGSVKETVRLCHEASQAGADYAIVIAPGYFHFAIGQSKEAYMQFYLNVLKESPLPVMIYNFPGAAAGVDYDSEFLIELSEHPNCFGVKLTCASISKGHRVSLHTQSKAYLERHPQPYFVFPGYSDYLLAALTTGASGCITGTANVYPKTLVKLYELSMEALKFNNADKFAEAQALQDLVTRIDNVVVKAGISGTKYILNKYVKAGLGGVARMPLPEIDEATITQLDQEIAQIMEYEESLWSSKVISL